MPQIISNIFIIILMASMMTAYISAILWVYNDAYVRTTIPPILAVILVFMCSPVGLIIYLAIREKTNVIPHTKRYKKTFLVSLAVFVTTLLVLTLVSQIM